MGSGVGCHGRAGEAVGGLYVGCEGARSPNFGVVSRGFGDGVGNAVEVDEDGEGVARIGDAARAEPVVARHRSPRSSRLTSTYSSGLGRAWEHLQRKRAGRARHRTASRLGGREERQGKRTAVRRRRGTACAVRVGPVGVGDGLHGYKP